MPSKRLPRRPFDTPCPDELETIWDAVRASCAGGHGGHLPHLAGAAGAGRHCRRHPLRARARAHPHLGRGALHGRCSATPRRRAGRRARSRSSTTAWGPDGPTAAGAVAAAAHRRVAGLNPRYTFEQFVICDGNRLGPRRGARRRRDACPGLQPALHPRHARASARRTSCTRSATTSRPTATA